MNFKDNLYSTIFNNLFIRHLLNKLSRIIQIGNIRKRTYRNDKVLANIFSSYHIHSAIALDIGSGPNPKNPFKADEIHGADLRNNPDNNVVFADLSAGLLPFEANKFDFITAFDVLEHIQRVIVVNDESKFPLISIMNEIFRVLKPGGLFYCIQPVYPAKEAFQDPTHVNIMTEDTLELYFCAPSWARIYGYEGSFELIEDGWIGGQFFCLMKKVSDQPIRDLRFVQK